MIISRHGKRVLYKRGCQNKFSYHTAVSKENVKSFFKVSEDVSILWKMFVMIKNLNYDILKINQIISVSEMTDNLFILQESNTIVISL